MSDVPKVYGQDSAGNFHGPAGIMPHPNLCGAGASMRLHRAELALDAAMSADLTYTATVYMTVRAGSEDDARAQVNRALTHNAENVAYSIEKVEKDDEV